MSTPTQIECKPSKWFKKRAVMILIMFIFFLLWFLKDGLWGYRENNVSYVHYQTFSTDSDDDFAVMAMDLFNKEKKAFEKENEGKTYGEEQWRAFASTQKIAMPDDAGYVLPKGYDTDQAWPEELVNGFEAMDEGDPKKLWDKYAVRMEWDEEVGEKLMYRGKINEQYWVAGICGVLILITIFISVRIWGRNMRVTDTAYFAPGGKEIPFTSMKVIDKRKWDNKGLATIHYEEDGETKKAKVDGMVYGQFDEEDDKPAERLFEHILANFKGELLEFIEEDEDDEGEEETDNTDKSETNNEES